MAVIATIVFVSLWGLAYGLLGWIPCVPVSAYWNLTKPAVRFAYGSLYVEPFVVTYTSMTASNMVLDSECEVPWEFSTKLRPLGGRASC